MNFDSIKRNYDRRLWTANMVATAVKKGVISPGEYRDIVGKVYGG